MTTNPKTVLVVDDDEAVCSLLERILAKQEYVVEACATTEEVLKRLAQGGIAVVLLDLTLDQDNGWETLRLIRREIGASPPILIITGTMVDGEMRKDARLIGAQGIIMKPFDFAELFSGLKEVLSER